LIFRVPKKIIFFAWLIFFACSCKNRPENVLETTPAFDSVLIRADKSHDSGNKKEELQLVLQAHSTIKNLTIADEIDYFNYCNVRYGSIKNYDKCIEIADSMLMLLDKADNNKYIRQWQSVAYNAKADALFAKGLYNDAYDNYFKAHKTAKDNADSCSLRTYAYSLAMVLYKQQRFKESAASFKEAFKEAAPCSEDFNLFYFKQEVLDNIGLCYNALHEYDSAMNYYTKALDYLNGHTGKYDHKEVSVYEAPKAVVYGNMAEIFVHKGALDTAAKLYNKSIAINLQKGYSNTDALMDQAKLADLYFSRSAMPDMKTALFAIRAELDTIPEQQVDIYWNKLMWKYYEHEHDSLLAFRHLRTYLTKYEAFNAANKALMATDLDTRVSDMEKQYRINLLTEDKKYQKAYLLIVSILAVMAFVIVLLVWRNAVKSQKNVWQLTALNNQVNEQKNKLELALTELKQNEKEKIRILKSVAHDVMNPIAAIVSLTEILAKESLTYSDTQQEIIELIREASTNSLALSRDILEASAGIDQPGVAKENTDINVLLTKSVELLNYQAMAKNQHLKVRLPNEHVYAYVYREKIWRIINNLIANAIKFSFADAEIVVTLEQTGDDVHLSVKDNGIGIPEKNKPFVFDMFTDAKTHGTSGETPHGLGLSISLNIAKAHNGNIWFESTEGVGSTFHLQFPVSSSAAVNA
jgi:two-component system sensor histidine kinase VicK